MEENPTGPVEDNPAEPVEDNPAEPVEALPADPEGALSAGPLEGFLADPVADLAPAAPPTGAPGAGTGQDSVRPSAPAARRGLRPLRPHEGLRRLRRSARHAVPRMPRGRLPRLPSLSRFPGGARLTALAQGASSRGRAGARWVRGLPWQRIPQGASALRRQVRYDPDLDHTRTRQQRIAARSRRLEVAAAGGVLTIALLVTAVAPSPSDVATQAHESSRLAEGVSRPDAVDTHGAGDALPRAEPVNLRIPHLGTDVEVFGAELDPDGGPPTPSEEDAQRAAWHAGGVSPGEPGAALVVGHLDTYDGPAAFAGLGTLTPGSVIEVDRDDGTTAMFIVDSVEQYQKDDFPDDRVYGAVDSPQLRLITCGGQWTADGGYDANIVAYARLDDGSPAPGEDGGADPAETEAGLEADPPEDLPADAMEEPPLPEPFIAEEFVDPEFEMPEMPEFEMPEQPDPFAWMSEAEMEAFINPELPEGSAE